MCGLAGIVNFDARESVDPRLLRLMAAPLAHRGPDGQGFLTLSSVGLAHRRLSIIDLERGAQPIHNEDRTVWTVLNGEIFNYVELRESLAGLGHRFYTDSDTEVLVHLYEQYGDEFVEHLNGQFAIAIWDDTRKRLVLVRDRPGIIPLFVREEAHRLSFASEVKALLPLLGTSPSLNPRALDQIMTFWAPSSPDTIFEGIQEVSPGEMVVVEDRAMSRRQYWDLSFPMPGEHVQASDRALAEELYELLVESTRIRLRSDVPVGVYVSGGLDSAAIASMVAEQRGGSLRSFSLAFEDPALDESQYQAEVVERLGSDHQQVRCATAAIADALPDCIWHMETPIVRAGPVPMSILSGMVHAQGYKVVLTGEGADEVLGGYDIFKEAKIREFWARRPNSRFRSALLRRLYPYLEMNKAGGLSYLEHFFGQGLSKPELPHFSHLPRWTLTARTKAFLAHDFRDRWSGDPVEELMERMPVELVGWSVFNRAQYLETKSLMAGYILSSQGDRMLMANSVEGRFPFLDHRVMEFANTLHPKHKMRALNEKALLKRAFRNRLPNAVLERYKQPYRAPDIDSFFGESGPPEYVLERLSPEALRRAGYFAPDRVEQLLKKIRAGRARGIKDNMAFMVILTTQLWHQNFIDRSRT